MTAHSLASASPSAIGTSTGAPDVRRSVAKSAKTVAASAWRAIRRQRGSSAR
jgi:hypothetical protein